jgi:hypothetical protein
LKPTIPKFCKDCKYFIPNSKFWNKHAFQYSKCSRFNTTTVDEDDNYLVNGVDNSVVKVEYSFCSTARKFEHMCGKSGKMFENM